MKKLKIALIFVVLAVILVCARSCNQPSSGALLNQAFSNYDRDHVNELKSGLNGDTYCSNCKKFTEGKVRICPHCGQYIK